jgi:hypothetical protein
MFIQNMFRFFVFLSLFFPTLSFAQLQDDIFVQTERFMKKYVVNGQIKYADIYKNKKELENLTKRIAAINYVSFYENLRKTYLINSYNLLVIKGVIDNYPITSTNEIKGFFTDTKYILNGKNLSLDQIEKELILKQFSDPRIHFVLIKAANGSPAVLNYALNPQKIDAELDAQCKKLLNDPNYIRLGDKSVLLPQIFEWNHSSFNGKDQSYLKFINQYRDNKISENLITSFYPFDWTLNDTKPVLVVQKDKEIQVAKTQKDSTKINPVKVEPKPVEMDTIKVDSMVNLQLLTPARLIPKGHFSFRTFNSLLSHNQVFSNVKRVNEGKRTSSFTSVNEVLYAPSRRLNIGFEFWVKSVYVDTTNQSSFNIFGDKPSQYAHTGIVGLGPKIKISPLKKHPAFTLQSTFLIPFSRDLEGRKSKKPYLSADAAMLITQLMYDKTFRQKWQLFLQFSPIISLGRSFGQSRLATPLSCYVGYLPNSRLLFYLQNEIYPIYGKSFVDYGYFRQGIGTKIQIIPKVLEGEIVYQLNTIGYKTSADKGISVGLRMIK